MKAAKFIVFFGVVAAASATSLTTVNFNFTGLAENAPLTGGTGPFGSITNYMNSVLSAAGCTGCSVTVTGAFADTTWNGGGHTTGPGSGGTSLTLGNSNGATASNTNSTLNGGPPDTFLATTNDTDTSTDSQITMTFSGLTVSGAASFDYEIFPDALCAELDGAGHTKSCGVNNANLPGFTFQTGTGTIFTRNAVAPGTTNGAAVDSLKGSAVTGQDPETAPQYIGAWGGSLSSTNQLDFIDWPATIGIDNLSINFTPSDPPSTVPEPVSVFLLGSVVAGLAVRTKFLRKTA